MIRFEDVSVTYEGAAEPTLRGVDFEVPEGELVLLVGPSGTGKSTLLNTVGGLVPHFTGGTLRGRVTVAGRDTRTHKPRELADVVGTVGQDPLSHFVTDTVEDELAYGMESLGLAPAVMRRRVEETLDLLGLSDLRDRSIATLSGGQRQRVAIGSVLTPHPRVLVLDEPTSALDPAAAEEVLAVLQRLVHDLGTTVLMAEHRLERVIQYADRVAVLPAPGAAPLLGTPAEMMAVSPVCPPVVELGRLAGWTPLPLTVRDARRRAVELRERLADLAPPTPDRTSVAAHAPEPDDALRTKATLTPPAGNALDPRTNGTPPAGNAPTPNTDSTPPAGNAPTPNTDSTPPAGIARHPRTDGTPSAGIPPTPNADGTPSAGASGTLPASRTRRQRWFPARRRGTTVPAAVSGHVAEVRALTVRRTHAEVLHQVGLTIAAGETVALMGRNGAGKSTLLSALVGLVEPSAGTVRVAGLTPHRTPPRDLVRQVGLVPQEPRDLLYADTVAAECAAADRDAQAAPGSCRDLLSGLLPGVPDDTHPRDLSEGQRLTLALAVVLTARPPLLLLDEPTRGLDYAAKARLVTLLRALAADGHAIVLATHDVELAAELADRVILLAEGEVIADGPTADVVVSSPSFAPQVTKILAPRPWLTVAQVREALR
ncbi:ABC transporter ATP-binding protein [Streptomyces sp. SLBN-31]|uniref:ABC transporter ATP-binding protein n=1 Tax=Streptomyces sp. SLBN-31 TaxID=2768444 RepID=UPI00115069AA|nr:ABC transporter ATP-binding protein [Streptomyces sp. SLBN-31]TQJ87806.1 energy-coupling factor transport system ATP-binding protein [Streptomyces sp. SLBN-31]